MTPETIISLRPNVTRDEATRAFSDRASNGWRRVRGAGPLRSIAELYVPFTLFQATICHGKTRDVRLLAIDRFTGALDPFTFERQPVNLISVNSRNCLESLLSQDQAQYALTTKLQRVLFQKGFFRVSGLDIRLEMAMPGLYMPYWLGFFGSRSRASLEVLDGTRRVFEGNKLRTGVRDWLCR